MTYSEDFNIKVESSKNFPGTIISIRVWTWVGHSLIFTKTYHCCLSPTRGSWSLRIAATGGSSASSVSGGARSGADVVEAPVDPVDFVE